MKKLCFSILFLSILLMSSCEKCYDCISANTINKPLDICGKGVELNDAKSLAERAGYTCSKK